MSDAKQVSRVTERAKPELVTIGNRQVISSGRWNNNLMADYVMLHGGAKWLSVGELGKVAWGQNTPTTKVRTRKCLSKLFTYLLVSHGRLLVIEYGGPNNCATAVKMYDPQSEQDRQVLAAKLERMFKRRELTAELYDSAISVLQADRSNADFIRADCEY